MRDIQTYIFKGKRVVVLKIVFNSWPGNLPMCFCVVGDSFATIQGLMLFMLNHVGGLVLLILNSCEKH